jgi:hypothetical protein
MINIKGYNSELCLDDNRIIINYRIPLAGKGTNTIPIKEITSVNFKLPSLLTPGYIRFAFKGNNALTKVDLFAPNRSLSDGNIVFFKKNRSKDFQEIKEKIEQLIVN